MSSSEHDNVTEAEDPVVTLDEYIAEEEALEADARAVLGSADGDHCSYTKGYMKRQPLYSCRTCKTEGKAGVCLACSLHCHDNHDLIELYTKRQFKCDCGNSKFKDMTCKLVERKDDINTENQYNHNYEGLYCDCERPYPDTEIKTDDEQIQCIICEDWFHSKHLTVVGDVPGLDTFDEMACHTCMHKLPFLYSYSLNCAEQKPDSAVDIQNPVEVNKTNDCKVTSQAISKELVSAAFFESGWRDELCKCAKCMTNYIDSNVEYLVDSEDTVDYYESQANDNDQETTMQRGLQALGSQLNNTQQIELIHGYNDLKDQFSDFARTFADEKKVITENDVKVFFSQLNGRKRQRLDPPTNCH